MEESPVAKRGLFLSRICSFGSSAQVRQPGGPMRGAGCRRRGRDKRGVLVHNLDARFCAIVPQLQSSEAIGAPAGVLGGAQGSEIPTSNSCTKPCDVGSFRSARRLEILRA